MEVENGVFLPVGEPMVARQPAVVLVDLAVAFPPVEELAPRDADPGDQARAGQFGLLGPGADVIDDGVAGVVGNPGAVQGSPRLFFSSTCSSMSSAITPSLRWSLA
jgi:hypothetical protein